MEDSFGARLAAARRAAGLNQTEVAERLTARGFPVRTQAVSKWETDTTQPSARQLVELCRLYGIRDVVAAFGARRTGGKVSSLFFFASAPINFTSGATFFPSRSPCRYSPMVETRQR